MTLYMLVTYVTKMVARAMLCSSVGSRQGDQVSVPSYNGSLH